MANTIVVSFHASASTAQKDAVNNAISALNGETASDQNSFDYICQLGANAVARRERRADAASFTPTDLEIS